MLVFQYDSPICGYVYALDDRSLDLVVCMLKSIVIRAPAFAWREINQI